MIYFDHAATSPMSESSLKAYCQVAEKYFGNPSSLHDSGSEAERALESARKTIAKHLGVQAKGLHFTGSGSEANFLVIVSLANAHTRRGRHIVTTPIEHSSVRNTFKWLEKDGFEVSYLPVNSEGQVTPEALRQTLRDDTILASIQHVNSEIGTVQDLRSLGEILRDREVLFHSDMVQSFGKIPSDLPGWGIDSATITAHKIQGPKGIGVAYIDNSINRKPLIPEATQERGFRPGTVDVPAAVAFAVAADEIMKKRDGQLERVTALRDQLVGLVRTKLDSLAEVEGNPELNSPFITGISLKEMEGQHAMLECNRFGLAISTGSACQVNEQNPSKTMLAIGKTDEQAQRLIRISLSDLNQTNEIDEAVDILHKVAVKHRDVVTL
ncbi:MAG: IscS subfamily cysteine desulfurase [Balneolaceae bacterium]